MKLTTVLVCGCKMTLAFPVADAAEEAWDAIASKSYLNPLGSEDFSMYLEHAPGMMFRLGVGFKDRAINYHCTIPI